MFRSNLANLLRIYAGGYDDYNMFDSYPSTDYVDRSHFKKISDAAMARLESAQTLFMKTLEEVELEGGKEVTMVLLQPNHHLVDACFKLFRKFVIDTGCRTFRKKLTPEEKQAAGKNVSSKKNDAYYISVIITPAAKARLAKKGTSLPAAPAPMLQPPSPPKPAPKVIVEPIVEPTRNEIIEKKVIEEVPVVKAKEPIPFSDNRVYLKHFPDNLMPMLAGAIVENGNGHQAITKSFHEKLTKEILEPLGYGSYIKIVETVTKEQIKKMSTYRSLNSEEISLHCPNVIDVVLLHTSRWRLNEEYLYLLTPELKKVNETNILESMRTPYDDKKRKINEIEPDHALSVENRKKSSNFMAQWLKK